MPEFNDSSDSDSDLDLTLSDEYLSDLSDEDLPDIRPDDDLPDLHAVADEDVPDLVEMEQAPPPPPFFQALPEEQKAELRQMDANQLQHYLRAAEQVMIDLLEDIERPANPVERARMQEAIQQDIAFIEADILANRGVPGPRANL